MENPKKGIKYQVGTIQELMKSEWFDNLVTEKSNIVMNMLGEEEQTQEIFNIVHTAFGSGYLTALADLQNGSIGTTTKEELMEGDSGKARRN